MPAPDAASNVSPDPSTSPSPQADPSGERLFVLLPALNEARQIGTVVRDVMALRIPGVTVQAVVIDDVIAQLRTIDALLCGAVTPLAPTEAKP